jgi:hypothetical protein
MDTPQDVVSAGVTVQALLSKHLGQAMADARSLVEITRRGVEIGMCHGHTAKTIIALAEHTAGQIGAVMLAVAELHQAQTDICKVAGVDLGSMTEAFGTAIVQPDGGGR